jgi:hypothetical protein
VWPFCFVARMCKPMPSWTGEINTEKSDVNYSKGVSKSPIATVFSLKYVQKAVIWAAPRSRCAQIKICAPLFRPSRISPARLALEFFILARLVGTWHAV